MAGRGRACEWGKQPPAPQLLAHAHRHTNSKPTHTRTPTRQCVLKSFDTHLTWTCAHSHHSHSQTSPDPKPKKAARTALTQVARRRSKTDGDILASSHPPPLGGNVRSRQFGQVQRGSQLPQWSVSGLTQGQSGASFPRASVLWRAPSHRVKKVCAVNCMLGMGWWYR